MDRATAIDEAKRLVDRSRFVMVGSTGEQGYPNIKAMLRLEHEDLTRFFLSTNTSSKRVSQFRSDPRACLYLADFDDFQGLMLIGDMTVRTDAATKQRLWQPGWEIYYPGGATDPDYCVLEFTARTGNYYHGLENTTFEVQGA
jgi:general stress protein 26